MNETVVVISQDKKSPPLGVKVIAIAYLCITLLLIILAIFGIVHDGGALSPQTGFAGTMALVLVVFLWIAIAWGLYKGKKWAKVGALILSGFAIIGSLRFLFGGNITSIISLIIHIAVAHYLAFNKNAKDYFAVANKS